MNWACILKNIQWLESAIEDLSKRLNLAQERGSIDLNYWFVYLKNLKRKLAAAKNLKPKDKPVPKTQPKCFKWWHIYPHYECMNTIIVVGKNKKESSKLYHKLKNIADWYFHIDDYRGGSVYLLGTLNEITQNIAGSFAIMFSEFWKNSYYPVNIGYTEMKNVILHDGFIMKNKRIFTHTCKLGIKDIGRITYGLDGIPVIYGKPLTFEYSNNYLEKVLPHVH